MPKHEKTKPGQGILSIALANFDSWMRSPRTLLMLLFIAAICYLQMCGYKMTLDATGYAVHFGETIFYEYNFGCNMPMTTALFLIMVSELPRRISFQQYALIRSSRWRWTVAQILYCFMMVVAMLLLIFLFISIFSLPLLTEGSGWSDTERLAQGIIQPQEAMIEEYIRNQFSPLQASLLAAIPMFCFWFVMVLLILLCGIWGKPVLGVLVYAFIMLAHLTIYFEYFPIPLSMPMHFATLTNIVAGHEGKEVDELLSVTGGYMVLLAGIVIAMLASTKRVELNFYAENKL